MSLPYFRYFLGDHLKVKVGMTYEQQGIYTKLIEISWEQTPPGTLPNDPAEIARLLGVPLKRFTPQVPIVLRAWKRQGKRLVHDWLQQEYTAKLARHTERSEAGKKGNKKRWDRSLSDPSAIAKGSQSYSESYSESNSKGGGKETAAALPKPLSFGLEESQKPESKNLISRSEAQDHRAVYEKVYIVYPNHEGGKEEAWKIWEKLRKANKLPALDILLKAIEVQKQGINWQEKDGKFIPHFSTWLNKGQWTDEPRLTRPRGVVL